LARHFGIRSRVPQSPKEKKENFPIKGPTSEPQARLVPNPISRSKLEISWLRQHTARKCSLLFLFFLFFYLVLYYFDGEEKKKGFNRFIRDSRLDAGSFFFHFIDL